MSWNWQLARFGNYEMQVHEFLGKWKYLVLWRGEAGASTATGKGTQKYDNCHEAREAAVRHLATLLPKAQSKRLLSSQSELDWQPWNDPREPRAKAKKKK